MWDAFNKRYSLTAFDVFILLVALVLLAGLNLWQLRQPVEKDRVVEGAVRPPQVQRMPDDMQFRYDRWVKESRDVSVFARGEEAYGWVTGYLDEESAKADAMAWCLQNGKDCRVAEIRNDLSVVAGLDVPVTGQMAVLFGRFQMTSGPAAFAVSGTGAYAAKRGITHAQAQANALGACAQFALKDRKEFLPAVKCRLIAQR